MMADSKRGKPSTQCSRCGKVVHDINYANKRCYEEVNRKRCEGIFISMLRADDWEECSGCTTGRTDGGRCIKCSGDGWINIRDKK
jgi:hypothetical protein